MDGLYFCLRMMSGAWADTRGVSDVRPHLDEGTPVVDIFCSVALFGQQKQESPNPPVALELPITMQQNATAGKTPVGKKIQVKLLVATLFNGVVMLRNAMISGEVIESTAKTKTEPSRLAIRMDSEQ